MVQTSNHILDCSDIKALLSALVDDQVEPTMRHDAERHLAECDACRALLDEAESLDRLLHADFASRAADELPAGFEDSVLSLMRNDHRVSAYWRHWTTWAGWCAAAACLLLAASMWITQNQRAASMNNRTASGTDGIVETDTLDAGAPAMLAQGMRRSWTLPAPLESELFGPPAPSDLESGSVALPANRRTVETQFDAAHETGANGAAPEHESPRRGASPSNSLTEADRSAIYLASIVLDMIQYANDDASSFTDAREIIVYDNLLHRLAESRDRLAPADRPALLEAEMVLRNAVHGPVDDASVDLLRQVVNGKGLSAKLDRLSIAPRVAPAI